MEMMRLVFHPADYGEIGLEVPLSATAASSTNQSLQVNPQADSHANARPLFSAVIGTMEFFGSSQIHSI
jgi:hypothetical protein